MPERTSPVVSLAFAVLKTSAPDPKSECKLTSEERAEIEAALANGRRQRFQSARLKAKDKSFLLTNVYSKEVIQVWLKPDPQNGLELVEVAADESLGQLPEWLDYDVGEMGWDYILDSRHCSSAPDQYGNRWSEGRMVWCLEEGIAPGQPFLVELPRPYHSVSHTQDGTEYDTEYEPSIIAVFPWKPARVAKVWARELKEEKSYRQAEAARRRKLHSIQRHDTNSMFLSVGSYFSPGQSCYDDMELPRGTYYCLQTTANLDKSGMSWATGQLARGEDHDGDHTKAMEALIAEVRKKLPHLDGEFIRSLPVRHGGW